MYRVYAVLCELVFLVHNLLSQQVVYRDSVFYVFLAQVVYPGLFRERLFVSLDKKLLFTWRSSLCVCW